MIEKKILIFGLLVLFLLPASALAADGDSSPESTIVFYETLPDDIMFYPDNETHGTGYAESFADVSEWQVLGASYIAEISSDGDLGNLTWTYGVYGYAYDDITETDFSGCYIEYRISAGSTQHGIRLMDDTTQRFFFGWNTGAGPFKRYVESAVGVDRIDILVDDLGDGYNFWDYLRIANSTSMGWQHDGSTTAGVIDDGDAGVTFTASSDGDKLTLNTTWVSGNYWSSWRVLYDATTTAADINRDYYPFYELQFTCTKTGSVSAGQVGLYVYYDGHETVYNTFVIDGSDVTIHGNMAAETATDSKKYIDFYSYMDGAGDSVEVVMDWVKIYSIANFTVTQSSTTTDDYLYVDSGILYSNIDDGYIELNHDPTLSVAPDTYPLYYNLSTIGTAPQFSMYVVSWSTYSDETRGVISSRIVTDIKLKFDSTEIISEIRFAMDDISIFDEVFLSLDMWGYLGPMAMIVIGYVLTKKEKFLGVLWFAVECLFVSQYLALVEAMPDYWWHIFILLVGGLFTCVYPLLDR